MRVRLGTRGSRLALWQAHRVMDLVRQADPRCEVELVIIRTSGDVRSEYGEELNAEVGEFSSELERCLHRKEIDAAVHSAKDLPTRLATGLTVPAYPERADPRDALVKKKEQPSDPVRGAVVATGSPRRDMLWKERWPETTTQGIRGNVDRRLEKLRLDTGLWGLILACAGIDRLGGVSSELTIERLDVGWMVPAPGQGALAIECRKEDRDITHLFQRIDSNSVRTCVEAEKSFLQAWGGGCSESLGALATIDANGELHLSAAVRHPRSGVLRAQIEGPTSEPARLGLRLAEEMRCG